MFGRKRKGEIGIVGMVEFKSTGEFFYKEKKGIKNNTVRNKDKDKRFETLDNYIDGKIDNLVIFIFLASDSSKFFQRIVKDVSKYRDLYIITWADHRNE